MFDTSWLLLMRLAQQQRPLGRFDQSAKPDLWGRLTWVLFAERPLAVRFLTGGIAQQHSLPCAPYSYFYGTFQWGPGDWCCISN